MNFPELTIEDVSPIDYTFGSSDPNAVESMVTGPFKTGVSCVTVILSADQEAIDAIQDKIVDLRITGDDVDDAVAWARRK